MNTSEEVTAKDLLNRVNQWKILGYDRLEWNEGQQGFHVEGCTEQINEKAAGNGWKVVDYAANPTVILHFTEWMYETQIGREGQHFVFEEVQKLFEAFLFGWVRQEAQEYYKKMAEKEEDD